MKHRSYKVKKRLALTSLIDIIFLLLLFLMLTSTFSKFSEIELGVATTAAKNKVSEKILFLRVSAVRIDLNSGEVEMNSLAKSIKSFTQNAKASLVISMDQDVTSQRLVDILGIVANIEGLSVNLIGSRYERKFSRREPTIALINIVFLMLIFFMITGTIAKPIEKTLRLIETENLLRIDPPDALVLLKDGTMKFNGHNLKDLQIL